MSQTKHLLSKSTFIRGTQCEKSLFLYKNYIQLRDSISAEQQAIFSRGHNIGDLARQLFPGGVDATNNGTIRNSDIVKNTAKIIAEGTSIIYEAAFIHEDVLVILDILEKKNNEWFAYEVKSSTKISPTYLLDAALQGFVIEGSGITLSDFNLIYVNNKYVRGDELVLDQYFAKRSVLKEVRSRNEEIANDITRFKNVLADTKTPEIEISERCFSPYHCDFSGHCWKHVPNDSVFTIGGLSRQEQFDFYRNGIIRIDDVADDVALKREQKIQVWCTKNKKFYVDKVNLKSFFEKFTYPLYFLDFEVYMPALPMFKGSSPYEHIPFQYSLHKKRDVNSEAEHHSFLAESGIDERLQFIEKLLKDLGTEGTILVFDESMEKNVLKNLKAKFPEHTAAIEALYARIIDVNIVFQNRWFYSPAMKGSNSIKNILPALIPDFTYHGMNIASGVQALSAFEKMQSADLFEREEIKKNLNEYSKLDTLALLKIIEKLQSLCD